MKWLVFLVLLSVGVFGECVTPTDGMIVRESVSLCGGAYDVLNGITIASSNLVFDCNTAVLRGIVGQSEIGLRLENVDNVTVQKCNILTFNQGVYLKNVTNSLIVDNAILKNRIGIRLLDSFENIIRDNSDKSFQLAVSAINSRFNVVMLGNKNVERSFCEVNSCNEMKDINVCVSGDFYCSRKCTVESDADCGSAVVEPVVVVKSKSVEELEKEVKAEIKSEPVKPVEEVVVSASVPIYVKSVIYLLAYFIALFSIRSFRRRL